VSAQVCDARRDRRQSGHVDRRLSVVDGAVAELTVR
jgi:hypothetical protein